VKIGMWMGFGDMPNFSKDDRTMFYVVPADGNVERKLANERFISAASYEEARDKMVAEVQRWYDHWKHIEKLEKGPEEARRLMAAEMKNENEKDRSVTSLSISGATPSKSSSDTDLLDLMDLAGDIGKKGHGTGEITIS
jgi:hypothetical protein